MAFTEFWCDASANGSNLNGGGISTGGDPNTAPYPLTYAGGIWVNLTGIFTVASGNPASDGVTVGDFASVYTAAATDTGFVGRVTARDTTTITVSLTACSGTNPANGTYTVKVGGRWKGPYATDNFPFNLTTLGALQNASSNPPRFNMTNGTSYATTSLVSCASTGLLVIQGCTSTPGDGGKFTLSTGASNVDALSLSGNLICLYDAIIANAAAGGSTSGLVVSGTACEIMRVVIYGSTRRCVNLNGSDSTWESVEVYGAGPSANGIEVPGRPNLFRYCYFHNNTGTTQTLVISADGVVVDHCIFDSNTGYDVSLNSQAWGSKIIGCDFYAGGSDAINIQQSTTVYGAILIENCNFFKKGAHGIYATGSAQLSGRIVNCAFGRGSQANNSGDYSGIQSIQVINPIAYAANQTPWNAPATGDFSITGSACKGTGYGTFTETGDSKSGTVAYPDIGAGQGSSTQPTPIIVAQTINRFIVPEGEEPNAT